MMPLMLRVVSLWRNLVRRGRVERDLDDEVRAMRDLLVDEKTRAGMPLEDAQRAATLQLGGVESVKEQVRDVRAGTFLEILLKDVRFAARLLRRNPLFTLTAALSLAIGIGATITVFTIANGLLLRSAPGVIDPERLVDIVRIERNGGPGISEISYPDYLEIRRRATTIDGVYAYQLQLEPVSLRVTDSAERVFADIVTTNYFQVLGVRAVKGRLFGAGDSEQPGASPVAVLSHRFWTRRFDSDPSIVGQTVHLNGHPFTIVGVSREGFRGTTVVAPDVWITTAMVGVVHPEDGAMRLTSRQSDWLMLGARVKPGVSRAQASAEVKAIGAALAREYPKDYSAFPPALSAPSFDWSAEVASPIPFALRTPVSGFLALLMALVSVVLIIVCANVAGVLLARATVRRREIAVRTAIGAARARLVRQLLTETMLLFVFGGATGLLLARVMSSMLVSLLPAFPLPVNLSVPLDGRVVAFSLGLSLVAAVLSGLAPALYASKADVVSALKDDSQGPLDRLRLRNAFVVAQVAFSIMLVVTAGLLVRAFDRVVSVDHGFNPRKVDLASVDLSMAGYTSATGPQFVHELIDRVRALPDVQHASLADRAPFPRVMRYGELTVPGVPLPQGQRSLFANWSFVESDYFTTLRIPLLKGRDFTMGDRAGAQYAAIVSESAARRFWPGKDPIGQYLLWRPDSLDVPNRQEPARLWVVGVVRDLAFGSSRFGPSNDLYVPFQQHYRSQMTILAQRAGDASITGQLQALLTSMNPNLPVLTAQTLESQQNGPVQIQLRVAAAVAGGVGLVGLLLAGIGVYGVAAYAVSQRTREIGIRLSLGARQTDVVAMILRQGMTLVAIGSIIGLILSVGAGRLLTSSRFGAPSLDGLVFVGAPVLFALVGLAACFVPSWRAAKIGAMEALRYE